MTTVPVRISSASLLQVFHGCDPGYIATVCHGACCRSSVEPSGIRVAVLPSEAPGLRARGLPVLDGRVQPLPGTKCCPAQDKAGLCGLHGSEDKPFGCIASPFILTTRDALVVRNRYRLLRCYKDGVLPAYVAFSSSLVLLFGTEEAQRVAEQMGWYPPRFFEAQMLPEQYDRMQLLRPRD